jgi:excisionase family DNA binding protein
MENEREFYTVKEFAEKIRVHPNTVKNAIKCGRIQAFKTGIGMRSSYRIPSDEIRRISELDMTKLIKDIVKREMENMNGT